MNLSEILAKLQDWFPVEDHKERQIKGGGKWYYLPHQAIRDRLNEICPGNWVTEYDGPHLVDGEPIYHCRLTICGVTRTGIGDKSNEPSAFGTGAQRAFRKAFADAAEQFGIGAYLDEQTSEKTKRNFIKYMQSQGNGKAAANYLDNQRLDRPSATRRSAATSDHGESLSSKVIRPTNHPFGQAQSAQTQATAVISEAQRKRLYAIAANEGKYTDAGFRRLIEEHGFAASKDVTKAAYEALCDRAKNSELAVSYNQEAAQAS
jgi:hypothetical protein